MHKRPCSDWNLDSEIFRSYYYLKEEPVAFCRVNGLPMSGGKVEITERIGYFLDTGNISDLMSSNKSKCQIGIITEDSKIEEKFCLFTKNIVFSLKKK